MIATETAQAVAAIRAEGLCKSFRGRPAVIDLSLEVRPAEIFGLLGPDGAGKTTTMRLLLGLLPPDRGRAFIGDVEMTRDPEPARSSVGYVSQRFSLYGDLTVAENIAFAADLRHVDRATLASRERELLDLTQLAPFTDRLANNLSGGMKQKLALVCGLIQTPRVLLLDEPTTGVDPVSRREFWKLLYGLPEQGVTLLVSTPYVDEAQRCHRLGFMAGGRLLAVDSPEGLVAAMPDGLIDVWTSQRGAARSCLKAAPGVRRVETVGAALRVAFDPADRDLRDGEALVERLRAAGMPIERWERPKPSLDDVFSALSEAGRPLTPSR